MKSNEGPFYCGCALVAVIVNVLIGGWSVDYLLWFFLSKDIPWIGDALIGLIVAEISIPVALVVWLLRAFGVL